MLAARREREIVDKFFEKQKSRHTREHLRLEQKMLDDLAARRGNSILSWNPAEATHEEAPYLLLDDRAGRRGCLRHFHRAFLEDAQARAHFVPSDPPRP